jgi:hypothetical protein
MALDTQTFSSLSSSALQYIDATLCPHSSPEAVGSRSFDVARLVGSFHGLSGSLCYLNDKWTCKQQKCILSTLNILSPEGNPEFGGLIETVGRLRRKVP